MDTPIIPSGSNVPVMRRMIFEKVERRYSQRRETAIDADTKDTNNPGISILGNFRERFVNGIKIP